MKITCGNCGKDIVVPEGLVAGQHVRCPYCNEKSAFDMPTRVELPEGFTTRGKPKPKLALRRPPKATTTDRDHLNAAAAAVDARVRKNLRRRRLARFRESFGNFVSILALLVLLAAGYVIWKAVREQKMPAYVPAVSEKVTQFVSNAVEKVNAEIAP